MYAIQSNSERVHYKHKCITNAVAVSDSDKWNVSLLCASVLS